MPGWVEAYMTGSGEPRLEDGGSEPEEPDGSDQGPPADDAPEHPTGEQQAKENQENEAPA